MSDATDLDTNTADLAGALHPAASGKGVDARQSDDRGIDPRVVNAQPRGHGSTKWLVAVAAVFVQLAAGSPASPQPTDRLDTIDRELIARLGDGIIGEPIEPIDPEKLVAAMARPHSAEFRVIEGPQKGKTVQLSVRKEDGGSHANASGLTPSWVLEVPGVITEHLVEDAEGLSASTLVIGTSGMSSTYRPPEPMLLRGIAAGKSKSYVMDVRVHPLAHPEQTKYKGQIRTTYSNRGSYRIQTPAGAFNGTVVRSDYQGKLGPATMNDVDIRIYSPTVGLIAIVTHNRLHAALLLNRDKHITLLVEKLPPDAR